MSASKKIEFVSGLTGSSVLHVNLISLVSLASIALYAACITRKRMTSITSTFLVSWSLLVLPLLLSMTAYAYSSTQLSAILVISAIGILFAFKPIDSGMALPNNQAKNGHRTQAPPEHANSVSPLPALSIYRANMMIMTVIAILAVDFRVFPRGLAKCETFGVSLMDMGVGSFVFSQGIVSAIPVVKDPGVLHQLVIPKLKHTMRKSLPILFLGLMRVILVKGTEYPEHVTEYGVHWNFFITLGVLPSIQVLLHPLIANGWLPSLAVAVSLGKSLSMLHLI
jgi:phosphatidylinositol glycan class W